MASMVSRTLDTAQPAKRTRPNLALMDRWRDPVLAFDPAGTIAYANRAFLAMLGYRDADQVIGRWMDEVAWADGQCTLPHEHKEMLVDVGSTTTWRHLCGYPVSTLVWPMLRLEEFDPLVIVVLTEIATHTGQDR